MKQFLKLHSNKISLLLILVLFLSIRIVSWVNADAVEDHDSIYYLSISKLISQLDFKGLSELSPDATFLFPLFIAGFNLPGWSTEFGARLLTLASSVLLFFVVYKLSIKFHEPKGVLISLLILTFNPFFINFSTSILSEPLYIANVYFGFWFFLKLMDKSTSWNTFLLGIIFGLSFLNRTEGIVFLVFIPFLFILKFLFFNKRREVAASSTFKGIIFFMIGFLLLSIPQIWYNSNKMGTFALNGRQVWQTILHARDNKSYDEKLRGLDFSDKDVNLKYLQKNPSAFEAIKTNGYLKAEIKNFVNGFTKAYSYQINQLVGILVLIAFGMGILSLLSSNKTFELVSSIAFLIVVLVPPLFHNFDLLRHIAIAGPILFVFSGIGISYLSDQINLLIKNKKLYSLSVKYLALFIFLSIPLSSASLIEHSLQNLPMNREYSYNDIIKAIDAIKNEKIDFSNSLIVSRKNYFPFYAGIKRTDLPYTSYEKLLRYMKLNNAKYIFFQSNEIENYPYAKQFLASEQTDFILRYQAQDKYNHQLFLYEVKY